LGLTKQDADYGYDGDNDYRDDDDAARPKRKRKRRDWLSHLPDNDSDIDNGDKRRDWLLVLELTKQHDADYGYDGDNDDRDDDDAAPPMRKRRDGLSHLADHDSDIDNGDGEVCCYSICLAFLWINSLFLFVIFTPVSLFQS